jgi:hypothetical protein
MAIIAADAKIISDINHDLLMEYLKLEAITFMLFKLTESLADDTLDGATQIVGDISKRIHDLHERLDQIPEFRYGQ